MASLLDRIMGQENPEEIDPEIPDKIPPEWTRELSQDPPPDTAQAPRKRPRQATTSGPVTPALKRRIAAELEAYIELAAIPLVMQDETCGGALHEQAEPIAKAIAQILARYPEIAHKFLATGLIGDWLKLLLAIKPVGQAMWKHHVVKPPEQEGETGEQPDYSAFQPYRPGQ